MGCRRGSPRPQRQELWPLGWEYLIQPSEELESPLRPSLRKGQDRMHFEISEFVYKMERQRNQHDEMWAA